MHLVMEVLQECQKKAVECLSFIKTLVQIWENFFFEGMRETIRDFVQMCPSCQRNKASNQALRGKMQPIPPGGPCQMWGLDIMGPFPKSHLSSTDITLVKEYGSRYCLGKTIGKVTSKHIILFMDD